MQAQREEGTDRAWTKARSTVSWEHGTIRGTAGDSHIVKGTDARPRSQDFVPWTVEHEEGSKGPKEANQPIISIFKVVSAKWVGFRKGKMDTVGLPKCTDVFKLLIKVGNSSIL